MQPNGGAQYLLVDAEVLPEAFSKVVFAKRLLAQGKAHNLSEATRMAGLSRSAFYKYRDRVFAYEDHGARRIAILTAELADEAGVLSALLSKISERGANILTINQNIPVDGVALVSLSLQCDQLESPMPEVVKDLSQLEGVVRIRLLTA